MSDTRSGANDARLLKLSYDRSQVSSSVVHLGVGAFHRAHQAYYFNALLAHEDCLDWGITGVNLRPADSPAFAALQAQSGSYVLKTVSPEGEARYEEIGALIRLLDGAVSPHSVDQCLADAQTQLVTITVTEGGYYLKEDGLLDIAHPEIAADLQGSGRNTLYAFLHAGLRARMQSRQGPITLLSCDNLRHNGDTLKTGFTQYLQQVGDVDLLSWLRDNASFPNAMVDRITPRLSPEHSRDARERFGVADALTVMAEDFVQWVVEDDFAGRRPPLERVGVTLVEHVQPYEEAKIRILNGGHTALSYYAALRGFPTYDAAVHDPELRAFVEAFEEQEAIPALGDSPLDLHAYWRKVLARFGNRNIGDRIERICADGGSKFPIFILPTLQGGFAAGRTPERTLRAIAYWYVFMQRVRAGQAPVPYYEPEWPRLQKLLSAPDALERFVSDAKLWGDLPQRYPAFGELLRGHIESASRAFNDIPSFERKDTVSYPIENLTNLQGKTALVTGAGGGIGAAVAEAYLAAGASCVLCDLPATPSKEAAAVLEQYPETACYVQADVTDMASVDRLLEQSVERFGGVDILFNNAAVFDLAPLLESNEAMYERIFSVNVKGAFFTMQKVAQHMVDSQRQGKIINLASQAGRRGEALVSHYCASKAAIISYTQSAALALAKHNINVNGISPGVVDTPMWEQVDALFAKYENLPLGEKKRRVGLDVPLGRMGAPEDICGMALFLASPASNYITAQTFNVDGGNVMS
ncbi:L-iditol 2-dehydrogenase [Hahella sp. CR1]|uniref:L-iditol 2-dehydrogenase n=1 Tax=Hahella sp. CR1 TaxID=2992807 RepID=UPI0032612235